METLAWLEHAAGPMLVIGALVAFLFVGHKLKTLMREFLDVPNLNSTLARIDEHEKACLKAQEQTHTELAQLTATMQGISTKVEDHAHSSQRARKEFHDKLDALAQRVARIEQQLTERT